MRIVETSDMWWRNAIIYCVDVAKYLDDDGDGHGDFAGLSRRLDYLSQLGVTCLWLMPIFSSPGLDDGYDVSDFYGIDPKNGSHGDLVELIRTARDRGIRVIIDLVVNHTSERHPWFQSARRGRNSRFRDFYVWRDEPPENSRETMFPGVEDSPWEWDERTEQYYLHTFYRHQPDLDSDNPEVRAELSKVIGYWLQLGVSGFRLDAVPSFVGDPDEAGAPRAHGVLQSLRAFAQRRSNETMLLGEVNARHEEQLDYFGRDGASQLHMQFDFVSNQALYLSLAREDAGPLREALAGRPPIPPEAQWVNFVRNHDELTLDKLTDDERDEVFAVFAPDEDQRMYGRGIRRRLPAMLDGDPRRIRMVYSLLYALPGAPTLFYGEEIGMGENPDIPGRRAVRTPMQWTSEDGGGFSTAAPSRWASTPPDGPFSPRHVNVEAQLTDGDSLLSLVRELAIRYRESPEIGWGELELIEAETESGSVLVHGCRTDTSRFIALHNFADKPTVVRFALGDEPEGTRLADLLGSDHEDPVDGTVEIDLPPYGFRWLRLCRPGDGRLR